MANGYKQQLVDAGVDVDGALDRFMENKALYKKFLLKFVEDKSFEKLMDCLDAGDASGAFMQAHALKGVAGNLGFEHLLEVLSPLTEQLRSGDMAGIPVKQEEVRKRYGRICAIINANKGE